jgi:hypothetical protein
MPWIAILRGLTEKHERRITAWNEARVSGTEELVCVSSAPVLRRLGLRYDW